MMKNKRKKLYKSILIVVSSLFLFLVAVSAALIIGMRPPEGNKTIHRSGRVSDDIAVISDTEDIVPQGEPQTKQVYTFLLAGKDKVADNTDTIMLVKLDITDKNISILNIPRDTILNTQRKSKKINSSYQIGGIELLEKDVADITGFYVNRYVLFNVEGVEKIIDAIGGVYFDVPRNMNYEDPTQNLSIHIKKGYQHLNGENAVKLARYRSGYTDGDIGRIGVQQQLLKELCKQALKAENILRIPEIVGLIIENIETDIDLNEMLWLANSAKDIPPSNIETYLLPGVASTIDNISYWLPYKNELLELINNKLNPLDEPITEDDISIPVYKQNKDK